jgi:hypothetical protein
MLRGRASQSVPVHDEAASSHGAVNALHKTALTPGILGC